MKRWLLIYCMTTGIVLGCAPATRHKVLNVFFDGVRPLAEHGEQKDLKEEGAGPARIEEAQNAAAIKHQERLAKVTQPFIMHDPYGAGECTFCHVSPGRIEGEIKDLCFDCHDDLLEELEAPHSPAEEGECLECHYPHQAKFDKLLVEQGQALCLQCHDMDELIDIEPHNEIGDDDCIECHGPHGD